MDNEREIQQFKQTVLNEYPKLREGDRFSFDCHPGIECFNRCCGDVTIVLSPYDILRMRSAVGVSSEEFLKRYTFVPFSKEQRIPVVMLRMGEDEAKRCPFVGDHGCTIYDDRPWACRMYPLGMASPKDAGEQEDTFYFLMQENDCEGVKEDRSRTVSEWLEDQGLVEYNKWGEAFKDITLHDFFIDGGNLDPSRMEMFYMACYDLDRFKRMVFESTFLDKFDIRPEEVESIGSNDVKLMLFAFQWLKFCIFGEPTMKVKDKVLKGKQEELSRTKTT